MLLLHVKQYELYIFGIETFIISDQKITFCILI